jgi:hypothetical protein
MNPATAVVGAWSRPSRLACLAGLGGLHIRPDGAGGRAWNLFSFDGALALRAWYPTVLPAPAVLHVSSPAGAPVLSVSWSRKVPCCMIVRSGSGRDLGRVEEHASSGRLSLQIRDVSGAPRLEVLPFQVSPLDFACARLPPRRARRVALLQRDLSSPQELTMQFQSRTLDLDEKALLVASGLLLLQASSRHCDGHQGSTSGAP